ncbi:MAG: phosphoribosylglycinamide formyltransferase [Candidatus Sumerlaeia bacterium]|nr:phosphoribosylglycinamide formyltransferase [Candidatus Sumerlaeia bacterium]
MTGPRATAVLASGRGSNLEALLEAQRAGTLRHARITTVLANREGVRALEVARAHGVEALCVPHRGFPGDRPAHERAIVDCLKQRGIELLVLAGYDRLLAGPLLDAFPGAMINIHPSLLPAFPGLHAARQAVEYGVRVAGCTVHFVTAEMDAGPVILQRSVAVLPGDDEAALAARILAEEHRALPEALDLVAAGALRIEGRRVVPVRRLPLLLATGNSHKVGELAALLAGLPLELRTTREFPAFTEPEEDGGSYEENALLKARVWHERTGLWCLADDSGIEVDALGGRPGLHSARYAKTAEARNAKLLAELAGAPEARRGARFVCVAALVGPGVEHSARGTIEGRIAEQPRGAHGFGYDPIFVPSEFAPSHLAELPEELKNRVSHRARALDALRSALRAAVLGQLRER